MRECADHPPPPCTPTQPAHAKDLRLVFHTVAQLRGYRPAVEFLKAVHPHTFGRPFEKAMPGDLAESTVRGWIVQVSFTELKESTIESIKRGSGFFRPPTSGRPSFLDDFPDAREMITEMLKVMREKGVAFTALTVRSLVVATMEELHPGAMEEKGFQAGETFIRNFVYKELKWTVR